MEIQTRQIKIQTDFIKLDQLLKFSGAAQIGSQAKSMIQDGIVDLNGEVCTMRGKKIRQGDTVDIRGEDIILRLEVI